jgi:chloramphenicol 3-O-phosphotransferase
LTSLICSEQTGGNPMKVVALNGSPRKTGNTSIQVKQILAE